MSHALAAPAPRLRQLLAKDPYITEDPSDGGELSNLTRKALQMFKYYYDPSAIIRESEILEEQFQELAEEWIEDTSFTSSLTETTNHPAYRTIVQMGQPVVRLLLRELETRPNFWFGALREITGANPVREKDRGHVERMAKAWLHWGREQGLSW